MRKHPRLSDDVVRQSVRWILRQREAASFLAALQGILEEIGPSDTCALHAHNERRKFASDLILMREEDADSDGSGKVDDGRKTAQPADKPRKSRRHGPAGW
ncbi:hypothetical protein G6L45_16265 [Agrobacterium rhizogenes]|nr:hypothetical protein [Rhizobium rhizogenes]NTH97039.1 hypothetical protein [Rhizobium rhizogenes]NTJ15225.1 hypothetical protein [Rhizobium rhizogenes]